MKQIPHCVFGGGTWNRTKISRFRAERTDHCAIPLPISDNTLNLLSNGPFKRADPHSSTDDQFFAIKSLKAHEKSPSRKSGRALNTNEVQINAFAFSKVLRKYLPIRSWKRWLRRPLAVLDRCPHEPKLLQASASCSYNHRHRHRCRECPCSRGH